MNKDLTEVVFVIDRSGSMSGLESDTIGGYNGFLGKQRKGEGRALITTVLFDTEFTTLHDREDMATVKSMTDEDYTAGGCTALMDAVGETIVKINTIQKHAREEDKPAKTVFCIITDGHENSSVKYNKKKIKKMISQAQEKDKWEFVFLGANIDAADEAESIGISRKRAVEYCHDSEGTRMNYDCMANLVGGVRKCRDTDEIVSLELGIAELREVNAKRMKKKTNQQKQ